jgi:hypothetical protein
MCVCVCAHARALSFKQLQFCRICNCDFTQPIRNGFKQLRFAVKQAACMYLQQSVIIFAPNTVLSCLNVILFMQCEYAAASGICIKGQPSVGLQLEWLQQQGL